MADIARVRDSEGREHFASRDSKFVTDGLGDGSLIDLDKEAPDAPADASNGNDLDAGKSDRRSRQREREAGNADDGDGAGVAEPAPGS